MAIGLCAAYVIARSRFRFGIKKPMSYWILLIRVLPPVAFTIPLYTMFNRVGILNTKIPATITQYLYNFGIKSLKFGFGSAGAIVMTIIVLILSSFYIKRAIK